MNKAGRKDPFFFLKPGNCYSKRCFSEITYINIYQIWANIYIGTGHVCTNFFLILQVNSKWNWTSTEMLKSFISAFDKSTANWIFKVFAGQCWMNPSWGYKVRYMENKGFDLLGDNRLGSVGPGGWSCSAGSAVPQNWQSSSHCQDPTAAPERASPRTPKLSVLLKNITFNLFRTCKTSACVKEMKIPFWYK